MAFPHPAHDFFMRDAPACFQIVQRGLKIGSERVDCPPFCLCQSARERIGIRIRRQFARVVRGDRALLVDEAQQGGGDEVLDGATETFRQLLEIGERCFVDAGCNDGSLAHHGNVSFV